jgi:ATP-dependent RNA helicase DHX36
MEMVKAVLCAGLYPQVAMCKVRNGRFALYTRDEGRVEPDPSSLITGVHNLPLPWLVYTEVVRGTCYIRDLTNVSNYMVLMFGGHLVCNNKNGTRVEMLGGFLHFTASKRATTIVIVCFHNPSHICHFIGSALGEET